MKHAPKDTGWRKLFITQKGEFVVGQKPNFAAWVWIGSTAAAYIFEPLSGVLLGIAYGAGIVWAYSEMKSGVNLFRRIMGGVVIFIIALLIGSHIIIG